MKFIDLNKYSLLLIQKTINNVGSNAKEQNICYSPPACFFRMININERQSLQSLEWGQIHIWLQPCTNPVELLSMPKSFQSQLQNKC
jgi:hypothetical protein